MQNTAMLYPVFVQVLLTYLVAFHMGRVRGAALKSGQVKFSDIALGEKAWPPRAIQAANSFSNQFEMPVLFYALAAFAMITSRVDLILIVLAWVYVALRIVHAAIHTGHNDVRQRSMAFLASSVVLFIMWAYFAASVIAAPLGL